MARSNGATTQNPSSRLSLSFYCLKRVHADEIRVYEKSLLSCPIVEMVALPMHVRVMTQLSRAIAIFRNNDQSGGRAMVSTSETDRVSTCCSVIQMGILAIKQERVGWNGDSSAETHLDEREDPSHNSYAKRKEVESVQSHHDRKESAKSWIRISLITALSPDLLIPTNVPRAPSIGLFSKFSKNKKYPKSNAQSVSPPSQEQLLLPKPATDQWAASKAPFPLPPARSGFSKQEMKAMASSNRNRPPTAPGTLNASNVHLFRGRNSKKSKKIPKPKNTTFRALEHEDGMVTHMWYQKNAKAYLMRMVNPYLKYPYTTAASADDRKAWIELNGEYSERPT